LVFESDLLALSVFDDIDALLEVVARLAFAESDAEKTSLLAAEASRLAFAEFDAFVELLFMALALRLAVRLLLSLEFDADVPDESLVEFVAKPVPVVVMLCEVLPVPPDEAPPPLEVLFDAVVPWFVEPLPVPVEEVVLFVPLAVPVSFDACVFAAEAFREAPSAADALLVFE